MTRSELVLQLAKRHQISRGAARKVVDTVFDGLADALAEGRRVELRGFGSMRARHYPAYAGRNPRTGAPVDVPHKVLAVFRPGEALLRRINEEES